MKPLFLSAVMLSCGGSASGAIVFADSFDGLSGSSTAVRPLSEGGWAGYIGNATTPASEPVHNSGSNRAGVVKNANTTSSVTVENYLFAQNQTSATGGTDYFLYTTTNVTTPFAPDDYTSVTATWRRNGNSVASYAMCLQVGGGWYVSMTNNFGTTANVSFDLLASNWKILVIDTTAGTGSLGASGPDLTYADLFGSGQTVTGVGFFINDLLADGSSRTIRLDDIAIEAVPEISIWLLAMAGGLSLLARRRRVTGLHFPNME